MEKIALKIPGVDGNPMQIDSGLPPGVPTGGLETTGQNAIFVFIVLTVAIAILFALWSILKGGLDIIMSAGHKEGVKSGRERVIYALLGLVFVFLSFVLIGAINAFFGGNLLPFVPFFNPK